MPFALFIVTVPAKIAKKSKKDGQSVTPVAAKVRDFIKERDDCQWISEEPFLNGKAWWTSFMFTNKAATTEDCVKALCELGVGQTVAASAGKEPNGKGMILVLPVNIQRVGSRPKVCGHPETVPYGAHVSPSQTPDVTTSRKTVVTDTASTQTGDSFIAGSTEVVINVNDVDIEDAEVDDDDEDITGQVSGEIKTAAGKVESFASSFAATIHSRISVDSVIQYCHSSSEFSFDYVMLIFNASVIACTGLVTNNTVVIVASMLVSPLMGPILAVTFGAVVSSRPLVKRGLFSETLGLIMCIVFGFVGGLCAAPACGHSWPTNEMASRGVPSALWTGVAIAIPSGFGAALSVLGNNSSSLVGVAISASLLPPAVNCGVLLAAQALKSTDYIDLDSEVEVNGTTVTFNDLAPLISFCVTLINVLLIYICAYLMFVLKGLGSSNDFWNTHIKNTRKYNRALRNPEERHHYEKAFLAAKQNRADSIHAAPMEKTKASWKWDPFKTSVSEGSTSSSSSSATESSPELA